MVLDSCVDVHLLLYDKTTCGDHETTAVTSQHVDIIQQQKGISSVSFPFFCWHARLATVQFTVTI